MRVTMDRVQKLAALGALGAAGFFALLWVLLVVNTMPFPRGGTDLTNAFLVWLSTGGVVAALIVVHLKFARDLWNESKRPRVADREGTTSGAR